MQELVFREWAKGQKKLGTSIINARYYKNNKKELAPRKKIANFKYKSANKKSIRKSNARYYLANKTSRAKSNAKYYLANKEEILHNRKEHRKISNLGWSEGVLKGLLQEKPIYKKCPPSYGRIVKFIDHEQLVDCLNYFKECGEPGYQEMDIDYSYMSASCELDPQTTKPKHQ